MLGGKPRYHRLYFINKIIENGLVDNGYVTMNKFFFAEYAQQVRSNNPNTDGTNLIKQEVFDYVKHLKNQECKFQNRILITIKKKRSLQKCLL